MKAFKILILLILPFSWVSAQNLKPYILGFESTKTIIELKQQVKTNLTANQIEVVGEYQPANDANRWIMVITSTELKNSVKSVGGLTGFASTLRVALTTENGKTIISYTNPIYWGNAYFQKKFIDVENNYKALNTKIQGAMKASGTFIGTEFGSQDGLSKYDLHGYHYMMGMPYFDDTVELEDFDSYAEAVTKIDASLKTGVPNVKMVYKLNIPGKDLTLYGFALEGDQGEGTFLPIIDGGSNPKHTAFLPYEVLVMGDEVLILHGRYRIALAFPDLTMGTFSKIMSTPGAIEELLEQLVD